MVAEEEEELFLSTTGLSLSQQGTTTYKPLMVFVHEIAADSLSDTVCFAVFY